MLWPSVIILSSVPNGDMGVCTHYSANSQNQDTSASTYKQLSVINMIHCSVEDVKHLLLLLWHFSLMCSLRVNHRKTGIQQFTLHAAQQVLWPVVQNRHQQMHPLSCRQPTQLMLLDQLAIIQSSKIHQRSNAGILREVNISSNWEWQMHWVVLQTTPIKLSGMVSFSLSLLRIYYYCSKVRLCSVFFEYF